MDIQVGDRITYKYKGGTGIQYQVILDSTADLEKFKVMDSAEILKIERPKYEVVEEKKKILDEKEKEYLWNVIKPFRDRVTTIAKEKNTSKRDFIDISFKDDVSTLLPDFEKDTMYRGMKLNKEYTLQELGLEEN